MDVFLDTCGRPRLRSLLLMCLFVLEAAADCPSPQGGQNIVLTNEAILMNDFPDGTTATLKCSTGHVSDGGSNTITCVNGTWTQPELICKKKDCGLPPDEPKMIIDLPDGTLFRAVAKVSCEKGYQLIGNGYKQCFATGWYGKAQCRMVTCGQPSAVANGKVLWSSNDPPKYEDVVPYACDDGYALIGKESITCTDTGHYDSQPPECRGMTIITEDGHTTQTGTPASTTKEQEASSSTDSPARPTTHRDKTHTTSTITTTTITTTTTTTTAPSSTKGARGIVTLEEKATTASVTSTTSSQDKAVDTKGDHGYTPLIVSVVSVTLVVCILVGFTYKYFLRRKGSYDTKEDLKLDALLQFQNL